MVSSNPETTPTLVERLEELVRDGLLFPDVMRVFAAKRSTEERAYASTARDTFTQDGVLEFDDDALVSLGDSEEGAYVQGWFWVDADYVPEPLAMAVAEAERIVSGS